MRSSPIEAQAKSPYNSIRKPSGAFHPSPRLRRTKWCVGCGCVVVCRRFPSGLEIAHQTPLPRAWPLATLLRKATFGRATLAYARHNNRGCRESYPRCTLACASPIGRGGVGSCPACPNGGSWDFQPRARFACALLLPNVALACAIGRGSRSKVVVKPRFSASHNQRTSREVGGDAGGEAAQNRARRFGAKRVCPESAALGFPPPAGVAP